VLATIAFNDQAYPKVDEVHDIWSYRLLAAEFLSKKPMCSQMFP
jgi:uncharacterized protein YozE (UPF0346 family)